MKARRGQVALYLILALVIICLLAVMNVDVFVAVRSRNRVQHAGDAAALAAAHAQGRTLNEIARLNLEHVMALVDGDLKKAQEIVLEQRRLALLGPLQGLRDADQAARKNGMEEREDFSEILREHVMTIRTVYADGTDAQGEPYPEPWPGAWTEYAAELETIVINGLATGPDNCEFYDGCGGHLLLNMQFYQAVAGRNWCWFHFHAPGLLEKYDDYHYWGPLPATRDNPLSNCEIFSLHVNAWEGRLTDIFTYAQLAELLEDYGERSVTAGALKEAKLLDEPDTWFFYGSEVWRAWTEIDPLGGEDGYRFPVVGEVRPEYDVRGCAAICRCVHDGFVWSAAAKPFGCTDGEEGLATANARGGLVVPCFEAVRLVPLDAVGGNDYATADSEWVNHIRKHLPEYLEFGPRLRRDCFYCEQLLDWERDSLRAQGSLWLKFHSDECYRGSGGGGGHGGTAHGH